MPLKSYALGCLVVMMGACSSASLKIYPPLQHYSDSTEFTSFICSNDDDSYVSADDVEWLYPNSTIMTSTPDYRIDVYGDFVTFTPPHFTDAGSYWCRRKANHSDMAEGKLMFKNAFTVYEERMLLRGVDKVISCSVDASIEQNNTIQWARFYPNMLISETLKYTINTTELIIHNVTVDDEGEYACYSEEIAIVYTVIDVIVTWSPELIAEQDEEVTVSVDEEVILNCTVSASPDPVYTWSFPDSCSSCPNTSNNSVFIFTAEDITDSGEYTCVAENKYGNLSVTVYVTVIIPPTFVFSNNLVLFEERITLLGSDVFINCSVNYGTEYNITSWLFDYEPLLINQTSKFSQNTSGLTVYNVTELDEGYYICYVDEIWAFILLQIARPPVLVSKQNQTVIVYVNEEVALNCSVLSVPDPVYTWSFPDSCTSCHNTSNDSVLIFTAEDITDSGEYTCVAENEYGNLSVTFYVTVISQSFDCGVPETPTNGIVKFDSTVKGSIANYECNEGCILNGAVQRVCEDTGQWSCNVPRCKTTAPDIIAHPTNATAAAPFSAVLTCSAKGCGKLNVIWHRHTKPLPQKAYSTMTTSVNGTTCTSTLAIPNVTIEDTGKYYCVVWARKKATQSREAHLFLADPPLQPVVSVASIVNLTHNNFNLAMKCIPHNYHLHYAYTWIKKDDVLPSRARGVNSPHLTIVNLSPEDSGSYQCIVSNRTGRIASKISTVKIIVSLPRITEQPDDVIVTTACNSTSFVCTASGFGSIKIVWKRINYTLPVTADVTEQKSLNEISSTLTISEIVGYYSGQYYCVVENEVGKISSQIVNLHVKTIRHPEMILPLENVTILPYQDCKLNCLALSSGVLTYEWSKRDGSLPQNAVKSYIYETFFNSLGGETTLVYSLAIPYVQLSDEGWYCCIATNEAGSTTACTWLEVNALPNITLQPAPVTFKAGDQNVVAMNCKATTHGITPIYYQWERYHSFSNSWIRPSQRAVNITSPQLEFSIIMEEDEGAYRCIAANDDGSVVSNNATIFVYGPPNIVLISNHTVSMEGDKVNLLCIINNDAHANYSLQISWYKDNKLIILNGNRISLRNEGSRQLKSALILEHVIPTDDGVYTCRAYNHPGLYSESKTNLTVEYAPHVSIVNPSPYMINVGSLGILYCRASGKPVPMVQWYKNGFPVNRIASPFQQALLIPNNTQHTTVYTCEGKNYAGSKKHMGFANITVILRDLQPCHPLLEAPENGERSVIKIDGFAKHISFSCNSNYALKGKSLATCNNGTWSSSTPTCKL